NPAAAELAEGLRDKSEDATRDIRIQLGELVSNAVEAKRNADTEKIIEALEPLSEATSIRPPSHELDAAHVALLVRASRTEQLDEALNRLAAEWEGRATVRLLGPMAPYDFVVTTRPAQ